MIVKNEKFNAALCYADLGYPVFPIVPNEKRPITKNGVLDATTDFDKIENFWSQFSSANIGIATEGLLVVDVDGKENPWPNDENKTADLAAGAMALTPREGQHYFFKQPERKNWRNTVGKIAPNVDTRANGGYLIVPPSIVGGKPYRWVETFELNQSPDELPEPPKWLCEQLDKIQNQKNGSTKILTSTIEEGSRNSSLTSIAGSMRYSGMEKNEILTALLEINKTRCKPPLPDSEVEMIAASISRYPTGVPQQKQSKLSNYELIKTPEKNGKASEMKSALLMDELCRELTLHTANWPRRIGSLLFVSGNGTIRWLENRDGLFAWLQERLSLYWARGNDYQGQIFASKAEFFSALQAKATNYEAVEGFPHEPPLVKHFYSWQLPKDYNPTGEYFQRLLDFFINVDSEEDRALVRALFLTPVWGGLPGRRPLFVLMAPDRGCGKSTLAAVVGELFGGFIELPPNERAEERLVSRLLSPEALKRRIVRIDNIKGSHQSALIEGLVTSPTISGHRLYQGEAQRPNTLTFILTGNALRLSRDLAERAFFIRLTRPNYQKDWEKNLSNFVRSHQDKIIADIVAELGKSPASVGAEDRFAEWTASVLGRCTKNPDAVIKKNHQRRAECDEELEEAELILEAAHACADEIAVTDNQVFIPTTQLLAKVQDKSHEAISARKLKDKIREHSEAGRLPGIEPKRTSTERGFMVLRRRE